MKTINSYTGENVQRVLFPDNQPHIRVSGIQLGDDVRLVWPLRSSLELIQLLEVSNALDHLFAKKRELVIPYLMAARYDRVINPGDSFDLQVVANLINSCGFDRVHLFDVHSDVATALIHRSKSHNNSKLVEVYDQEDAVLICPDAGAAKKIESYRSFNRNIIENVYCLKQRHKTTGTVSLSVLEPLNCAGRNCVIIDDLCDGGATFLAIAEQIAPKHLTLIISHGIFSKGLSALEKSFDQIICSDSYPTPHNSTKLRIIPLNL